MKTGRCTLHTGGVGLSVLLAAALLTGCNQSTDDLQAYIQETLQRSAPPPERYEAPQDLPSHSYPRDLDRDPFNRLSFAEPRAEEVATGPRPDPDRRREELEQYPLDALRMSGILEQNDQRWALIRDPNGTIHRVSEGNYLGQNHGRIVTITERSVELEELVRTGENRWEHRAATLASRE